MGFAVNQGVARPGNIVAMFYQGVRHASPLCQYDIRQALNDGNTVISDWPVLKKKEKAEKYIK
jgi:hypothetical protein